MSETTAQTLVRIAKGEVGYHEGRSGGHWNNRQKYSPAVPGLEWSQNQAWCATFVSWVALMAGVAELFPRTASCDVAMGWFKERKRWSEYPAIGAQIFFGVPGDSTHTGIVIGFDATFVYTVEGNTNNTGSREGDGVYLMTHRRTTSRILGYGYPALPEGITSADPRRPAPAKSTSPVTPPQGQAAKTPRWDALVDDSRALRQSLPRTALQRRRDLAKIVKLASRWSQKHQQKPAAPRR